jgi:diaminopimelate decarboxylase
MLLPVSTGINNEGRITIGGCDVGNLKSEYGTPLYIVDIATVKMQCERYIKSFAFKDFASEIIYASKAFCTLAMCQLVKQQGLSIDVSTGGELFIAIRSGFDPAKIYFHGNNKSADEIKFGIDYKVGTFIVDSFEELEAVNEIAGQKECIQKIMLRITPGIKAHTHKYIQTGSIESKFGFGIQGGIALEAVKRAAELDNINLIGVHAHIGSQIFNIEVYDSLIDVMTSFMAQAKQKAGVELTHLNIGGGLGIKYMPDDEPASIEDFAKLVHNALLKYTKKNKIKIEKIYLEPGRSIIGNAGTTLYEVGTIKEIPQIKNYIAIDGGMSDNMRPILYQAKYDACIAGRASYLGEIKDGEAIGKQSIDEIKYNIVGKHCESGDVIIEDIMLPEARKGDLILVAATGAYCYSMSSNYNGQPRSAVVAVKDGKSWVWVDRQSYEDLYMRDRKLYE